MWQLEKRADLGRLGPELRKWREPSLSETTTNLWDLDNDYSLRDVVAKFFEQASLLREQAKR